MGNDNDFNCPITRERLCDPVVTADGHTYERVAIAAWFKDGNCTSPLTNLPLPHVRLVPNVLVKSIMRGPGLIPGPGPGPGPGVDWGKTLVCSVVFCSYLYIFVMCSHRAVAEALGMRLC